MRSLTPLLPPKVARVDTALYVVERNVMVPMRDGVRLACDIYYPARDGIRLEGKFPAILERTPYNKGGRFHGMPPYPWQPFYASRGYICISQDTRGRFASEGTWHMMTDDVADGFDTARWLVEQPWSDGGFGMIGTSYVGGTQHAMALANPPGLKALVPVDAVVDAGYFGMRNGGAWEMRFTNWIFSMAAPEGSRASRDQATRSSSARVTSGVTSATCRFAKAPRRFVLRPSTRTGSSSRWAMARTTRTGSSPASALRTTSTHTRTCRCTWSADGTTRGRARPR